MRTVHIPFPMTIVALCLSVAFCTDIVDAQDYPNSVASTDFDYILETDPSTFEELKFLGKRDSEMPDKRYDDRELIHPAFAFEASFSDGTSVQLAVDLKFESETAARKEAERYVHPLGKLPTTLREGVRRVVVHQGGKDTTAFSDVGLIVLYSENATKRISNHDLEETVFHESVHASWDKKHASSEGWRRAQAQDAGFVTVYAKNNPDGEDLAESALFAYTLLHHPERLPEADAKKIKKAIPARIAFVGDLIPPGKPIFYQVGSGPEGASGEIDSKVTDSTCKVDLSNPGQLSDILSNALLLGYKKDETAVKRFLSKARGSATAEELFQMTLTEFGLEESELRAKLTEYLHCNCEHAEDPDANERAKSLLDQWK